MTSVSGCRQQLDHSPPSHASYRQQARVALSDRLKGFHTTLSCLAAAAGSADGGTPHNMPLEQLDPFRGCNAWGDPVAEVPHHQGLADIYCAGMALWSLIVGEMPLHRTIVRRGQDKRHDQYLNCAHLLKHELVSPCLHS